VSPPRQLGPATRYGRSPKLGRRARESSVLGWNCSADSGHRFARYADASQRAGRLQGRWRIRGCENPAREEGVTLCECDSDLGRSEHDVRRKEEEVVEDCVVPLVAHGWIVRQRGRRRVHLSTSLAPSLSFAPVNSLLNGDSRLKKQYADSLCDGAAIVMPVDAAGSSLTPRGSWCRPRKGYARRRASRRCRPHKARTVCQAIRVPANYRCSVGTRADRTHEPHSVSAERRCGHVNQADEHRRPRLSRQNPLPRAATGRSRSRSVDTLGSVQVHQEMMPLRTA